MLRWSLSTRRTLGRITRPLWATFVSATYRDKSSSKLGSGLIKASIEQLSPSVSLQAESGCDNSASAHEDAENNALTDAPDITAPLRRRARKKQGSIRDSARPEPVLASLKAAETLRFFLADSNANSSAPAIPSATRIRRLYMFCRNDPSLLTSKERSAIISFYGTLSLPSETRSLLENPHPLALHLPEQSQRPWWSFIWLLLQDQRSCDGLAPEDLTWYFATLRATNGNVKYSIVPSSLLSLTAALLESPTSASAYDYQVVYTRSTSPLRSSDRIDHTELVRFFGALALPAGIRTPYDHPAAEKLRGEHHYDWTFISTLLRDKRRVKALCAEDMYWLVVARSRALGLDVVDIDADPSPDLLELRLQHIGSFLKELHSPEFGIASYIEGLLHLGTESASREAIAWLCGLTQRHTVMQPSLQRALWRTVLREGNICEANQERLLGVVHSRIFDIKLTQALPAPAAVSEDDDGIDTSFHKPAPLQAEDFLLRVSSHIFPIDSALDGQSPSQTAVKNWTRYLAQTMFDPKYDPSARWLNLVYLAFANTPSAGVPQAVSCIRLPGPNDGGLHPVDLRLIVLLTVFERLASSDQLQAQMAPLIERLWRLWAISISEHITVHSTLVRPLLASFFMLAGHLDDSALLRRMLDLSLDKTWIWQFDFGDDPAREQVQALVTAYIAASALSGHGVWEEIIAGVPGYAAFPQWVPSLLGAALARVARVDPVRAAELQARWGAHVDLPRRTLAPMALALANAGEPQLALSLLPACDFKQPEALSALGAVLYPLCHARDTLDTKTLSALSTALRAAVGPTAIPSYMRGRITWLLFQLIQASHTFVNPAMEVVAAIQKRQPHFFKADQVGGLIRALLRRRNFKHAMELLERVNGHYSRRAVSAWSRLAVITSVRTAHRDFVPSASSQLSSPDLVSRANALITHLEIKRDPYTAVLAHESNARRRWRKVLNLFSRLHKYRTGRSPAFARAIRVVLAMRGEKKLMDALRRLRPQLLLWECTTLGNILLRYWIGKRDPRVRSDDNIAATIDTLKTAVGFVPDRITLNILVGRALRRSKCPVRALFDELVRSGYPAPSGPPFDIPWRGRPLQVLSMLDGSKNKKISSTKHVRPLYKTFIRALDRKGDVEGMQVVVGVLKFAQMQHGARMREKRLSRYRSRRATSKLDEIDA